MKKYDSLLFAIIAICVWSLSPTLAGVLQERTNYITIVLLLFIFAIVGLFLIIVSPKFIFSEVNLKGFIKEAKTLDGKGIVFLLCNAFFISTYYICFYSSLHMGPRVEMNIINFLWPIFTAIFSTTVFKNSTTKIGMFSWALIMVSFLGASFIAFDSNVSILSNGFNPSYLIALGAAVSMGTYLNFILKLNKYFSSAIYIYFLSLIIGVGYVFIFKLVMGLQLIINYEALKGIAFICIVVFIGGQLAWAEALKRAKSMSIATIAYFTPILSASILHTVLGDKISSNFVLGASLIIASNFLLNLDFKHFNAASSAFVFFSLAGLYVFATIGKKTYNIDLGEIGFVMELFGILVAFIYSRIHAMKRTANDHLITINHILERIEYNLHFETDRKRQLYYDKLDNFFMTILDLDFNYFQNRFQYYTHKLFNDFRAFKDHTFKIEDKENIRNSFEELDLNLKHFISYSNYSIGISEKLVIWLLGLMSILSFFVTRNSSFVSDIFALSFSMAVVFLLVQINDFNKNDVEFTYSDLVLRQQIFSVNERNYYIPKFVLDSGKLPWKLYVNEDLIFRYRTSDDDEHDIEEYTLKKSSVAENLLAYGVILATIIIIITLIFMKHEGIV